MEIKRELLENNGLHPSILDDTKNTYVNEDYSIRLWKSKIMDGWQVSIINNYGHNLDINDKTDLFVETETKLFSGHMTSMEELNKALAACDLPKFKYKKQ